MLRRMRWRCARRDYTLQDRWRVILAAPTLVSTLKMPENAPAC